MPVLRLQDNQQDKGKLPQARQGAVILMKELDEVMSQLQAQNQQLQGIMSQKQNYMLQMHELETALEHLAGVKDQKVYKAVGPIIIETGKSDVVKELEESKEDADLRIKTLESQEEKMKKKMKETQKKFQDMAENYRDGEGG